MRVTLTTLFLSLLLLLRPAFAAELIMMEQQGCHYCDLWDKQIGPAYPLTQEGKSAPLRKIDIHQPVPADLAHIRIERFTPSFVLIDNGKEIGRIRGYPGDEFFWFLLNELLDKIADR